MPVQGEAIVRLHPASVYLGLDPESLGCAALIEWINHEVARPEDTADRNPRFLRPAQG